MKKNIIQLIKIYLQQGHCVGVLSFLLWFQAGASQGSAAPGLSSVTVGEPFAGGLESRQEEEDGENTLLSPVSHRQGQGAG